MAKLSEEKRKLRALHERDALRDRYTLSPENWDAFMEHLDAPPRPNAKLKALLARSSQ